MFSLLGLLAPDSLGLLGLGLFFLSRPRLGGFLGTALFFLLERLLVFPLRFALALRSFAGFLRLKSFARFFDVGLKLRTGLTDTLTCCRQVNLAC